MTSTTRTASTVGPLAERRRNATSSRMTARVVGILLLAAMLTYGPGSGIVAAILDAPDYLSNVAASQMTFTLGAVLMFINSVAVAGIGVLLFPILKRHSEQVALAYYASRLVEAVLLIVGVISLLSLTAISGEYLGAGVADASRFETLGALAIQVNDLSYQIAMAALGVGSMFLCHLLYQTRLIPRSLSVWGFAGYAVLLAGALLEILGVGVGLLLSVPGGLFEVFLGVWLIAKGFDAAATAPATLPADDAVHGFVNVGPGDQR